MYSIVEYLRIKFLFIAQPSMHLTDVLWRNLLGTFPKLHAMYRIYIRAITVYR